MAARSFAQNPAHSYDLAADLPQLRAEIAFLEAAATTSPAALYHPPTAAVAGLDETHRTAVAAITSSPQTVQPLRIHPGADKPAALAALAATAHHHNSRILALPATQAAADYAGANRYADTTATPRRRPHPTGQQPLETAAGQPDRRRRRRPPTARTAALAHPNRRGHQHQTGPHQHRRRPRRRLTPCSPSSPTTCPRHNTSAPPTRRAARPPPPSNAPNTTSPPPAHPASPATKPSNCCSAATNSSTGSATSPTPQPISTP